MKKLCNLFYIFVLLLVAACSDEVKYHIGVSQCSEDDWRALLNTEIDREARFFGDIDVDNVSADDDSRKQTADIERFISEGKDLIIVAPNVAEDVRPAIEKAYDKGIPVILIDRRTSGEKYTAFIGANNTEIGRQIGALINKKSEGKNVNVVELCGLKGSSPEKERHDGFQSQTGENVKIVASAYANWNEGDAEAAMDSLLLIYNNIDYIFAHNDRMALGAYKALKAAGREKEIKIVGVDGLITPGGGVDMILDGQLLATHTYPTGGSEAIQLAHKILTGEAFDREITLPSALVDSSNARVMHLQYLTMVSQDEKYQKLESITDRQLEKINQQKWMLGGAIAIVVLLVLLLLSQMRIHREKKQADDMMMMQMTAILPDNESQSPSASSKGPDNQFLTKVQEIIIAHIGDSDFSVNDIAAELGMSRVQLYRKIKAASDQNVSDLIRTARLEKAKELLKDTTKTVSEVAYAVGFSSPSYFTKCFKDQFGISPSELK